MRHHTAYCSACDRPVPVALRPDAGEHELPGPEDAHDLVCLDYGVRCTGSFCPLFSTPGEEGVHAVARIHPSGPVFLLP